MRILAVTGARDAQTRRRAMEAGMDGVLGKPLDLDELEAMLHGKETRREARA